jgi:hypothetical protein
MDKRYQVFVSSTYADLQDERQEVMQALLELDCIPAGMELFPAANEDQWTLIKHVIDDCDYYLVIVGGRYGSLGPEGASYTEMEYRYAIDKKKPVIGFLHRTPGSLAADRCDQTEDGRHKLNQFRAVVQKKMCRFWDSPADLGSQVSRSLVKLIKTHPAVGWVRADLVPDVTAAEEILRLRKRVEELETGLQAARVEAPEGTASLAQGEDEFELGFSFLATPTGSRSDAKRYRRAITATWNGVFAAVSPLMIDEVADGDFRDAITAFASDLAVDEIRKDKAFKTQKLLGLKVFEEDFQTIKVQLRALGLIGKSTKARSVKDTQTYWTLTPYGDTVMTRLRAIARAVKTPVTDDPGNEATN